MMSLISTLIYFRPKSDLRWEVQNTCKCSLAKELDELNNLITLLAVLLISSHHE